MKKILTTAIILNFCVVGFMSTAEAAMYDEDGNRIYGLQNNMRHGGYDPKTIKKQFVGRQNLMGKQKVLNRSVKKKRQYVKCNLSSSEIQTYRLSKLKLMQGAPRKCREDIRYIINIPYKTKSKKTLKPYEWKTEGKGKVKKKTSVTVPKK